MPMMRAMLSPMFSEASSTSSPAEKLQCSVNMPRVGAAPSLAPRAGGTLNAASEAPLLDVRRACGCRLGRCAETLLLVERLTDRRSFEARCRETRSLRVPMGTPSAASWRTGVPERADALHRGKRPGGQAALGEGEDLDRARRGARRGATSWVYCPQIIEKPHLDPTPPC